LEALGGNYSRAAKQTEVFKLFNSWVSTDSMTRRWLPVPDVESAITTIENNFYPIFYRHSSHLPRPRRPDFARPPAILKLERGLSHRKSPDEKLQACNHRQFGVTARWGRKTASAKQESIPGRVSQGAVSFAIRNTSLGPRQRGPGGGDLLLPTIHVRAKVCLYPVLLQNYDSVKILLQLLRPNP
jgi:hypothetical protein